MLPLRSRAAGRVTQQTLRSTRASRIQPLRHQIRHESSQPTSQGATHTPALVGGLAGGAGVFLLGYLWYSFSGAKTAIQTSNQVHAYVKSLTDKAKQSLPEASGSGAETIKWLRQTAHSYTGMIPGASGYVDSAFDDVEKIRQKHGDEVDSILKAAKDQLADVTKKDVSMTRLAEVGSIISETLRKITALAGDSFEDIINNHPSVKEKVGPRIEQLKQMGDQYGPEAKKAVDETWKEVENVLKGGFSFVTVQRIQDLIQRKTQELSKYGDQAWQKGLEQVKPMLDKQPELKEELEKNKDALLKGDLGKLWEQVRKASDSGNLDDLKKFVQQQAGEKGGQLQQYKDQAWEKGMEQLKPFLDKKPELKEQIEKNKEALLNGDVNELWQQVKKASDSGDADKLKSFVQEQLKEYKGMGDQAWQSGLEQAKPILDRVPELRDRIEKNKEKLMDIDLEELWGKVKEAGKIGNTAPLERWVDQQLNK
jgi:hypothetical protein